MKRLLLFIVLTVIVTVVSGQKSIDALFQDYAGRDGFVTVTINGNLLNLIRNFDDDQEDKSIPANVTGIRILAQEDDNIEGENFYDKVIGGINLNQYEEFMRVKESDQDLRMLVRVEGRIIKEFLLIAGGDDNALIQIKGEMTFNEAREFSNEAKKSNGLNMFAAHK